MSLPPHETHHGQGWPHTIKSPWFCVCSWSRLDSSFSFCFSSCLDSYPINNMLFLEKLPWGWRAGSRNQPRSRSVGPLCNAGPVAAGAGGWVGGVSQAESSSQDALRTWYRFMLQLLFWEPYIMCALVFSSEKWVLEQPQPYKMVVRFKRINEFKWGQNIIDHWYKQWLLHFPDNGIECWFSLSLL